MAAAHVRESNPSYSMNNGKYMVKRKNKEEML
jgi:DNA polymerase delta subunit 2